MKRKRPYKTVQLGFEKEKEYEKFHNNAIDYCGFDTNKTDCTYLRECCKQAEKKRNKSRLSNEAISELVNITEKLNRMMCAENNPEKREEFEKIIKRSVVLWRA